MLPKHYQGFSHAFPELAQEDHEKLFKAGLTTPGHVKKASDDRIKEVLGLSKTKKIRPKVK